MRSGRRIAIDTGKVRVGLAISDQSGVLSFPLNTIKRSSSISETCQEIQTEISQYEVIEIYVGYPLSLNGSKTPSTEDALEIAMHLSKIVSIPVRMIDERLSTVSASALLQSAGKNTRAQKSTIDQAAASVILEQALETERRLGIAPGISIEELV
jgi:putative Holliday junction resolvase